MMVHERRVCVFAAVCVGLVLLLAGDVKAQHSEECDEPLGATATVHAHVLCYNAMTGVVTVNITEGDDGSGFTFILSSSAVELENAAGVFTELAAGVYTAEVERKSDNCTVELTGITVNSPEKLYVVTTPPPQVEAPSTCSASDGSITVDILGGITPYTVAIGSTNVKITTGESATFENLAAGTYNVTVVDSNDCQAWEVFTINCSDDGGFPAWAIAVIVVGGILVIAAIAVFFICCAYKRHQKRYRDVFRDADEDAGVGVTQGDPSDF